VQFAYSTDFLNEPGSHDTPTYHIKLSENFELHLFVFWAIANFGAVCVCSICIPSWPHTLIWKC